MSETAPNLLSPKVNELQRLAAHPRLSAWVSASAGSGKTKVLADRVTRLLLDQVPPARILCLTFTRAAAAEMSIRLTKRLSKWATCDDATLDEELLDLLGSKPQSGLALASRQLFARVLACPGGMRIQTIHAFAQEILKRFPLEAGLPPHFTVMEDADTQNLRREAMMDMLRRASEGADEAAARALAHLSPLMAEDHLDELLKEIEAQADHLEAAFARHGGSEGVAAAQRSALGFAPDETVSGLYQQACREDAFDRAALTCAARALLEKGGKLYTPRGAAMCAWLEAADVAGRMALFEDYMRAFFTKEGQPNARTANKEILESLPQVEETIRTETTRLTSVLERVQTLQTLESGAALLTLAQRMMEAYRARKAQRAALDYDDLIARAIAVMQRPGIGPWVLFKLDGGIDHILLDESQDTNPSQWKIVKALAEEFFAGEGAHEDAPRTLFVVGDEKQSIYSFLKADPEAFNAMRGFFAARIRAADKRFEEVPLNVSFRSAPAILRAVDAVFEAERTRAGVSRDPVQHRAFRAEGQGRVELWPLFEAQEEDDKKTKRASAPALWNLPLGYEGSSDPAAQLAASLAAQIDAWVRAGTLVYDKDSKAQRPMTPGDVMVLVQRRGPFVDHLVRELKKRDVAVSGVDRMKLTQQLAVMDLLALLQFALLPEDDLNLACVLRGPLIGASEEDLMALAIGRGKDSLWQRLQGAQAYAAWRVYLEAFKQAAQTTPPLQLLVRVLSQPCPAEARSGRRALLGRLGPDAEDAIDELLGAAEAFCQRRVPSLQAFLHWITSTEAEVKRELEQAMGRVRITTVHASKGLEAPVVILPDTVRVPQKAKLAKLLWDETLGLPFYVPSDRRNASLQALREAAYGKQMQEHRRLLYVALTRPADRLLICGYKGASATSFEDSWYALAAAALAPHHQEEAAGDEASILVPSIVLADYALSPRAAAAAKVQAPEKSVSLPDWALRPPPEEPLPPRPLIPSRPSEEDPPAASPGDARFARGRLLHRLLQSLPDLPPAKRSEAARRFLANPQHNLAAAQQAELLAETMALVEDPRFAPLFGPQSRAEVPIIGLAGARLISGQVDRLVLTEDQVWIVDYKTNRPPPVKNADVPRAYRSQMEAYRIVLQALYPQHTVRCFLLWTYAGRVMEILPEA